MNVRCPHCQTLFRVDPERVPARGVRARCTECEGVFSVNGKGSAAPEPEPTRAPETARAPEPTPVPKPTPTAEPEPDEPEVDRPPAVSEAPRETPVFGPQDPDVRAQRFARALVSDIVAYHGDRRDESLEAGTLKRDFREEIMKSWEEYVLQVGEEKAKGSPYFRDALNDTLAKGKEVF